MTAQTHYTVSQLAALSGVSVRTLHHYDEIGLLAPAFTGENGYRYYREAELLRLQQILLHREFGLPLKAIGSLLDDEGGDRRSTLLAQRARLAAEAERFQQLLATLDRTIAALHSNGELQMDHAELYKGFDPARQAAYEHEIASRYGQDKVDASRAWQQAIGPGGQARAMADLADIEAGIAACLREGLSADDPSLKPWIARHRNWVATMWQRPCPPTAYAGLADMYEATPDFVTRFETIAPGLSAYLATAMRLHADA